MPSYHCGQAMCDEHHRAVAMNRVHQVIQGFLHFPLVLRILGGIRLEMLGISD